MDCSSSPHKQELLEFIWYYRAMVEKYEIPIHISPIDGAKDKSVRSSWEVLKDSLCLGRRVAVIGGGAVGLETAYFAAVKGTLSPEVLHFLITYQALGMDRIKHYMCNGASNITVFEMLEKAGQDVGKSTRWILMNNLKRYGVTIKTGSRVMSIKDGQVTYELGGEMLQDDFDTVILAAGSRPVKTLEDEIPDLNIPWSVVSGRGK